MQAEDVQALGDLELETSFSALSLDDFSAAALSAETENGAVRLERGTVSGALSAGSSFGSITVKAVAAESYTLVSSNGTIILDGASGRLDLRTSFGSISVRGAENAVLALESSNGNISFSGSLDPEESHYAETSFGGIDLEIPAGSAFEIALQTSFGRITSDIPISLSGSISQSPSENHWQGSTNGGGPLLRAETSNGDIAISVLHTP